MRGTGCIAYAYIGVGRVDIVFYEALAELNGWSYQALWCLPACRFHTVCP